MPEMQCIQIDSETLDLRRHCDHTHARQTMHIVLWKSGSSFDHFSIGRHRILSKAVTYHLRQGCNDIIFAGIDYRGSVPSSTALYTFCRD
jgi:hypothetical protein